MHSYPPVSENVTTQLWTPGELASLSDIAPQDRARWGNKAARLAALARAGYPVPAGFCIPVTAYRQHVLAPDHNSLDRLVREREFRAVQDEIMHREIEPGLYEGLLGKIQSLLAQATAGVAVRSSSNAEDLEQHSFAGLYESVLGVKDEASFLLAVRSCWASYWSDEAVDYREKAGLDHMSFGMAVLVQVMVPAAWAGVLFTRASHDSPEIALIEYVRGLGEALVSGEAAAHRLQIDRSTLRPLSAPRPALDFDLTLLLTLGLQCEQHQGEPVDMEWAIDPAGKVWVLQVRPITILPQTSLPPVSKPQDGWLITYDEPFSPLGSQIAVQRYHHWVRGINASFKTAFKPEIRELDGFLYYRPAWRARSLPLRAWIQFWRLVQWLNSEAIYCHYVTVVLPAYERRLLALQRLDLPGLDLPELLASFNLAVDTYLEYQRTSYAIGSAATLSASLLDSGLRRFFGPHSSWNALDLLTGIQDESTRRELQAARLGQALNEVLTGDELVHLDYAGLVDLEQTHPGGKAFWEQLRAFLREYGYTWADRYPRDPAWELNHEALVTSLQHAAQTLPEASFPQRHQAQQQRRLEAIRHATAQLSNGRRIAWRGRVFHWLLQRAEKIFPFKENRNHQTYLAVMIIRKYALEIGRRLQAQGLLPTEKDVFFLQREEIADLCTHGQGMPDLLRHLTRRKNTYLRSRNLAQKETPRSDWDLLSGKPLNPENTLAGAAYPQQNGWLELQGEACSPGLARGAARLVSGLGELQRVRPGEIVVCTQLRPAWSSVFARAGGAVIEMGSLLSHGSTLAREYGIPVVINIAGVTRMVRENDWLMVDGNLGKVSIERSASQGF